MIVDERFSTYVASLEAPEEPLLERIEAEALAARVPIIRKETQSFLKTLLVLHKPRKVLEIGTAVGFSALLMSAYLPEGGHITTIENYEKRIPIARENFRQAGKEGVISLIQGDAGQGPVYPLSAGGSAPSGPGRGPGLGQRAPGRGCSGIPVRGGAQGPDHPQPDAGVSL